MAKNVCHSRPNSKKESGAVVLCPQGVFNNEGVQECNSVEKYKAGGAKNSDGAPQGR